MSAARPWVSTQQSKWTRANQSGLPALGEQARTAADFTTHCFMWNGMLALKNNWPQSSHVMARGGGIVAMPRRDGLCENSIAPPARLGARPGCLSSCFALLGSRILRAGWERKVFRGLAGYHGPASLMSTNMLRSRSLPRTVLLQPRRLQLFCPTPQR